MSVFLIKKLFILNMEKNIKLHIIKKNNIISNDFSKIEYTKNNQNKYDDTANTDE